MTDINWPAGIPTPSPDGYGYSLADLNQRTDFAIGARVRNVFPDGFDTFATLSVLLSAAQLAYLQGWFRFVLQNGALWFNDPLEAAGIFGPREVRFVGSLKLAMLDTGPGNRFWRVTFVLETRIGTTMDADLFALYSATGPDAADILQALSNMANSNYYAES